jgi:hypothetical protein
MAVKFNLDMSKWDTEFFTDALNRVESAADVIRNSAKVKLKMSIASAMVMGGKSEAGELWREHGPYKTGKNAGASWTARWKGEMVNTIRTVRSKDPSKKNIWVMSGNYDTWWALQLEYGHGGWKGGKKSFFRPAMKESESEIISICENGGGPRGAK